MDLIHTLYEPPGDGPHPTLLVLHGWGANAFDLLGLAPHLCGGRFLALCPQGPVQTPIGPGAVGYGWYPLVPGTPPAPHELRTACDHILKFLDAASERYPIDPKKLGVVGFSQGGVMAYTLAFGAPHRFAALAALSTWCPPYAVENIADQEAVRYLATLVQHGSRDELVSTERARESVETLRTLRLPLTYREYDIGHEINHRSLADLSDWLRDHVISPVIAV